MPEETDFWRHVKEVAEDAARALLERPTGITPGVHSGITFDRYGRALLGRGSFKTFASGDTAANASITSGTGDFALTFNDDTADWLNGTPSTDLVLPSTGTVFISLLLLWQIAGSPFVITSGDRQVRIQQVRSASVFDEVKNAKPAPNTTDYFENQGATAVFDVVAGDILNLQVSQNSGSTMKCFPDCRVVYL